MPSYRIVKSGHIVEVYQYQHSQLYDDRETMRKGGRHQAGSEKAVERKDEYRASVNYKAREKVRRLISANFGAGNLFITLTFKENMQDLEVANYELKKFVQKMKRKQKDFVHVTVVEFQKRGAVHYHMVCNFELTWQNEKDLQEKERTLAKIWGNGFVDIKPISHVDNVGAYVVKYMTKENGDSRLDGQKRYFFSRNLIQPIELKGRDSLTMLDSLEGVPPVFTSEYYNEFLGETHYREYNGERYKK